MNKNKEKIILNNILKSINKNDSKSKGAVYSVVNLAIFAAIAYTFLSVKNGQLQSTTGIIISIVLGIIAGIIFSIKVIYANEYFKNKYIDKEKLEKRLNELNT